MRKARRFGEVPPPAERYCVTFKKFFDEYFAHSLQKKAVRRFQRPAPEKPQKHKLKRRKPDGNHFEETASLA